MATKELRTRVCEIIHTNKQQGFSMVVVVSAMGRENAAYATDTFINMIKEVNPEPLARELDILMSCGETICGVLLANQLTARGLNARFLSGEQAGIITDGNFGNAHIRYVNPQKIKDCLQEDLIAVVAGFQGIGENGEITTLGRGGSDTTASALGVALNAECIDIFTDVEGVMTADPRIVENARLLDAITYNELCQLARDGAKVVHPRAIEIAMQKGIPIRVRSTFTDTLGTMVANQANQLDVPAKIVSDRVITGITYTSNIAQIKINTSELKEPKGIELKVFKSLALAGVSVDFITVQPRAIMFTVPSEKAAKAMGILQTLDLLPEVESNCAKVAIVGAAMTGVPGIIYKMM
ncbi:MAG: aspartate kinase, partial [Bacilli bacterium]|nr:aspartate kinase [Bacilli bacterium]